MTNIINVICISIVSVIAILGSLILIVSLWGILLVKFLHIRGLTSDFKEFWANKHYKD